MSKQFVVNEMGHYEWEKKGSISTAGSALTTDKSAATVHALTATTFVRMQLDDGAIALNLRWSGGSDSDSNVQNLYAMRGDADHYTLIATLTFTTGTQVGPGSRLFVDTVVKTSEKWADDIVVVSDGANGIAHVVLNVHGYKNFLLLGTTVNSTLTVEAARE